VGPNSVQSVAGWLMDDGQDGVMHDSSPYGNDGTLQYVGTGSGYYSFAARGSHASRVVVPSSDSLNPGSSTFTVKLHVRFGTKPKSGSDYDLIRKGQSDATSSWKIEILDTGKAGCFATGSQGKTNILSASALKVGVWHTIVCTYSPTTIKVSVDANTRTAQRAIGSISNTAPLSIAAKYGAPDDGGDQYTGDMNNVTMMKQ
jgi:hypothetical protein